MSWKQVLNANSRRNKCSFGMTCKLKSPDKRDFKTNNKQIPSLAMQVSEGIPFLLSVVVRPEKNLHSFSSVISIECLLCWRFDEVWRSDPR